MIQEPGTRIHRRWWQIMLRWWCCRLPRGKLQSMWRLSRRPRQALFVGLLRLREGATGAYGQAISGEAEANARALKPYCSCHEFSTKVCRANRMWVQRERERGIGLWSTQLTRLFGCKEPWNETRYIQTYFKLARKLHQHCIYSQLDSFLGVSLQCTPMVAFLQRLSLQMKSAKTAVHDMQARTTRMYENVKIFLAFVTSETIL